MTKRISAAVLFLLLAAAAAFGQAGATTQIKNGPGPLPNPANNASAYVLNSGSPGLYVCLHSPTCTSSGQWVGPFGVGSGGTCSGCANASLSNLASVAINTSLGDQGNAGFNIQTEQDNNGGDTLPAGGFNYLGGLGGRYGPGGGFFVQTGGTAAFAQALLDLCRQKTAELTLFYLFRRGFPADNRKPDRTYMAGYILRD